LLRHADRLGLVRAHGRDLFSPEWAPPTPRDDERLWSKTKAYRGTAIGSICNARRSSVGDRDLTHQREAF